MGSTNTGTGYLICLSVLGLAIFLGRAALKASISEAIRASFDKNLDAFRSVLTKSEGVFKGQIEALTELRRMHRTMVPRRRHPDMDWHEACEDMALSCSNHADKLDEILCSYAVYLPATVVEKIEAAIALADDNRFEFDWNSDLELPEATREGADLADKTYKKIKEAVDELQNLVNSQINNT